VVVQPRAAGGEDAEAADLASVVERMTVIVERAADEVDRARVGGETGGDENLVIGAGPDESAGRVRERAAEGQRSTERFDRATRRVRDRVSDVAEALDRAGVGDRAPVEIGRDGVQLDPAAVA